LTFKISLLNSTAQRSRNTLIISWLLWTSYNLWTTRDNFNWSTIRNNS